MARSIPTPSHVALGAWVAACLILAAPFLDAGPHLFLPSTSGDIPSVNACADGFTINESSACIPIRCTAEWAAPGSISTDQPAGVPLVNKSYVAERIILNSARR
jgi:hypothetical protein